MMNLLPYGERFRTQRRMMQQTFNSQNVKVYRDSQKKRVADLLKDVLDDDQSWVYSVRQYVAISILLRLFCLTKVVYSYVSANVMKATYGHEIESDEDRFLQLAISAVRALSSNPAGGTDIVDFFPFRTLFFCAQIWLYDY